MAGLIVQTDLDAEHALQMVKDVARDLRFSVKEVGDGKLAVQKGNLVLSFLVGAWFVTYCNFRVSIHERPDAGVEIEIKRNVPWWTGFIGVTRVQSQAEDLAYHIEDAIRDQGGEALRQEE